jgi:hypothetical protein
MCKIWHFYWGTKLKACTHVLKKYLANHVSMPKIRRNKLQLLWDHKYQYMLYAKYHRL